MRLMLFLLDPVNPTRLTFRGREHAWQRMLTALVVLSLGHIVITDRLLGSIEAHVNALGITDGRRGTLVWRAKTLRAGSRSAAEEKHFGADLLGVLTVDTPGKVEGRSVPSGTASTPSCIHHADVPRSGDASARGATVLAP